jgi:signal transduction histidine kinase
MATVRTRTAIALLLLLLVVVAVSAIVAELMRRDRLALLDAFAGRQATTVAELAHKLEEDFDDVSDDMRFAGQLLRTAPEREREREIAALVAAVKQYHLVEVFDAQGQRTLRVLDPTAAPPFDADSFAVDMARTAAQAQHVPPGDLVTSSRLAADRTGWWRVLATSLPRDSGRPAETLAILVDMHELFGVTRVFASEPSLRLIVLAEDGTPVPDTDAHLMAGWSSSLLPLSTLLAQSAPTTHSIDAPLALAAGLPDDDAVLAVAHVKLHGGAHWVIGTLASTVVLRSLERDVTVRLGAGLVVVVLCLLGFGVYVLRASRDVVALEERLRNADAIAHLLEKHEKILDTIPTAVASLSAELDVTSTNRAWLERQPDARGQPLGQPLGQALSRAEPRVVDDVVALLQSAHHDGHVHSLLGARVRLFGDEGQYNIHAVPLGKHFPEARLLLVVEDLSAVRSLESQLLRAEKLASVGVLAAGIAHEIGTPLGIVRGRAERILQKLGTPHVHADGLHVIMDQIDLVTRTLRTLLDFSRVQAAVVHAVSLPSVARAVVELLRYEAERRGVTLTVDVDDALPPVAADADQLQQVLVNLLMNACDACAAGGHVTLSAHSESAGREGACVVIVVDDDGAGIPEDLRHQVFDPFFTTKKRGQGTGLGLTLTAQIVRNHRGSIELVSHVGKGTRVVVRWPVDPAVTHLATDRVVVESTHHAV